MGIKFITLITPAISGVEERQHSLALSDLHPDLIHTSGVIPHCARWRPLTAKDRDMLVEFLNGLDYNK